MQTLDFNVEVRPLSKHKENTLIPLSERIWFTLPESASYLSFSAKRVRRFIHDGELPATRVGLTYRINRAHLDQLMLRHNKVQPAYRKGTHPAVARRWAEYRTKKQKRAAR